jgi:GntR family transcriptional repressor for pyruvate dehydrogenase complex
MLRAVKQKRVYQDIVAQIQGLLDDGQLKAGHQLPSERELSELFQVSRASVREAIRALESMGYVEIRSGEGTYVATTVESLFSPLASAIREQKDPYREIFEARMILEPQIAALAAERASPSDVQQLETILEEQAKQIAQGETGVEADTTFHSTLARAARNKVFLRINEAIVESLREVREQSLQGERRPARSLAGHRAILKAIHVRDPAGARRAMLEHLEAIERNILRLRARERKEEKQRVLGRLSRVK